MMISIALCFLSCGNNKNNKNNETSKYESVSDSLATVMENNLLRSLMDKEVNLFKVVIPNFQQDVDNVVLICSQYDCVSCVESGLEISKSGRIYYVLRILTKTT